MGIESSQRIWEKARGKTPTRGRYRDASFFFSILIPKMRSIVESGLNIDDTWTKWSPKYTIMATTNNGDDLVVATLKYGKGRYIVTGIQNETQQNVDANAPLMENLLHYALVILLK